MKKQTPWSDLVGALRDAIQRLDNPFLVVTVALGIVLVLVGALAPGIIDALGREFFYLLLILDFLAFLIASFRPDISERLKPKATEETPRETPKHEEEPRSEKTRRDEPVSRGTPDELRDRYLHYLVSRCAKLKMTTIDTKVVTRPEATELDLHAVFTELDVYDAMRDHDRESISKRRRPPDEMISDERRLPAIAALSRYPRLVLLGDPGSGKSTLVNFVTLCLAGDWLRQPHANVGRLGDAWTLSRVLPIRIILRDYAARGLPAKQGLWDFLHSELEKVKGHDGSLVDSLSVLERYLKREDGALLLLDGLDEVPDAHHYRARLRAAVEEFALDFPECRIVVTTRPYAYRDPEDPDEPRVRLNNFEVRSLAPFNASQVESFIRRWYTHVGQKDPTLGARNAERYAEQLLEQIKRRPRLAELAENPLLLALMASLHRWREGGALPQKRQELYERSVELLLDLWQRPKQRFDAQGRLASKEYDVFTELGIEKDDLRRVLNCVAYQAHREQSDLVGTHDIRASVLAGQLYEVADKSKVVDQERIIRYLTDRAGLLIEREQGRVYTFPHRTFQEYLAACYLADDRYKLYERLCEDDERWREAMLLAAAKAVGGSANAIWDWIATFCPTDQPPEEPRRAHWYAALRVAQALIETELYQRVPERQKHLMTRLQTWLVALLETDKNPPPAPERAAAGRTLARLGDPRLGVTTCPLLPEAGAGLLTESLPDLVWCRVPAGPFVMGSAKEDGVTLRHPETGAPIPVPPDPQTYDDETPVHIQDVPHDYWISRYPVTNAQFAAFEADPAGYANPDWWTRAGLAWRGDRTVHKPYGGVYDLLNHPIVNVTWYEAVAFCRWLEKKLQGAGCTLQVWTHRGMEEINLEPGTFNVCLPSEAEWEKAARGGLALSSIQNPNPARLYPWDDSTGQDRLTPEHANYDQTGINATSAVGAFPLGRSPYGVLDLSGNVWEWCQTRWVDNYENYVKTEDNGEEGESLRAVRGGAFGNEGLVRCACRNWYGPNVVDGTQGFRVVAVPIDSDL